MDANAISKDIGNGNGDGGSSDDDDADADVTFLLFCRLRCSPLVSSFLEPMAATVSSLAHTQPFSLHHLTIPQSISITMA